ncbi:CopG family ribbon-helix-helix protein [Rhizobium laguerreae]|uniref:CopG family ribbon-helix-helix protein n=1 Tax=Rhizobium laguerreae TaxID=1076926 RepID=UPI0035E406A7
MYTAQRRSFRSGRQHDHDNSEKLDRIAADTQRGKSFLAGKAVAAYVERELEIIEGIKRGMADAEAGRVIPHDQAVAERSSRMPSVGRPRADEAGSSVEASTSG